VEADELNPRQRQIDHVLRTRERQLEEAQRELALMEDPMWAAKALVTAQMRMALCPDVNLRTWRRYAATPERVLRYLVGDTTQSLISVGMLADALDALAEKGLVVRGRAGDYWWDMETPPPEL
jgi:hypothetical protein